MDPSVLDEQGLSFLTAEGGPDIDKPTTLPAEWLRGPHIPAPAAKAQYVTDNNLADLPEDVAGLLEFHSARRVRLDARLREASGVS